MIIVQSWGSFMAGFRARSRMGTLDFGGSKMTSRVTSNSGGRVGPRAGAFTGALRLLVPLILWLGVTPVAADDPPPAKPASEQPAAQPAAQSDDSRLVQAVFSPRKDGQGNTWDLNSLGAVEYG